MQIKDVSLSRNGSHYKASFINEVLDEVSFRTLLEGPSGSGKTTILEAIAYALGSLPHSPYWEDCIMSMELLFEEESLRVEFTNGAGLTCKKGKEHLLREVKPIYLSQKRDLLQRVDEVAETLKEWKYNKDPRILQLEGWYNLSMNSNTALVIQGRNIFLKEGVKEIHLESLSAGQQSVFEILYEVLHQGYENKIILIDEIGLHLDPHKAQFLASYLPCILQSSQIIMTSYRECIGNVVGPHDTVTLR